MLFPSTHFKESPMSLPPSGRQVWLRAHDQELTIVEVGGGPRAYSWGGRPVLDSYAEESMASGGHGWVLLPWPGRLGGGAYDFDGAHHQTPLSEPRRGNSIHGLTRWLNWTVEEERADRATLGLTLYPQPGYPFLLELRLAYALSPAGASITLTARNLGNGPLPFGAGFHPYLYPGAAQVDGARLVLPAETALEFDERLLPTGHTHPVSGALEDFRAPREIGGEVLDACFTDLVRDADGLTRARVEGVDGRTGVLWCDRSYPFLQVYTGDTLAPDQRRRGVAVEPMTCPSDAFNNRSGLVQLEPGEAFEGTWGMALE
jgi:aldose 1-epimerase